MGAREVEPKLAAGGEAGVDRTSQFVHGPSRQAEGSIHASNELLDEVIDEPAGQQVDIRESGVTVLDIRRLSAALPIRLLRSFQLLKCMAGIGGGGGRCGRSEEQVARPIT
eukprot:722982-Heterocapsa_arctica.AAC.1